jgi:hypothetical protein
LRILTKGPERNNVRVDRTYVFPVAQIIESADMAQKQDDAAALGVTAEILYDPNNLDQIGYILESA